MAFSVNTNIASLQAQNYLRTSSEFQAKTINRVTSGLRIVSSGDDAAGLAIANGFRSDQAVLTQGIRNANDGLSTLQTIDGGMNNISQLLDRARTLATQSASGTFSGDRNVLNSEFQSVMTEIDRQAQSIGLNTNGEFAKSLQVFIGGGKGLNSASVINNGSVSVDLSKSTVDTTSLGLNSFRATKSGYDLSSTSTTSVKTILSNSTNTASEASAGKVRFTFSGAGFSDSNKITVDVNVAAVQNTDDLVNAINSAISTAANPTTATTATTAFKNAGVTASIVTDSDGKQQLSFSAPNTAFQVAAGDKAANALMGNIADSSTGAGRTLNTYVVGANDVPASGAAASATTIYFSDNTHSISWTPTAGDKASAIATSINAQISGSGDTYLKSGGVNQFVAYAEGNKVRIENINGDSFTAFAADAASASNTGLNTASSVSTTTATPALASQNDVITINGTALTVAVVTGDTTAAALAGKFNTAIQAAAANDAIEDKFFAYASAANTIVIASKDGSQFTIGGDANAVADFGVAAAASAATSTSTSTQSAKTASADAGGANVSSQYGDTKAYTWSALAAGETQTLTFSGKNSDGTQFSWSTDLTYANTFSATSTLDTALSTINSALQASGNTELAKIVAVKDTDSKGAQGIRFMSSDEFSVKLAATVGQSGHGLSDGSTGAVNNGQGAILQSAASSGSGTVDISNQSAAQNAVTALASAVTALGTAQAVVGKGQNNFNFAATLAQSQLTNLAAAESRIRDADLANEAANLSKAQILVQAGTAALAQANSAPQAILSLLRG